MTEYEFEVASERFYSNDDDSAQIEFHTTKGDIVHITFPKGTWTEFLTFIGVEEIDYNK